MAGISGITIFDLQRDFFNREHAGQWNFYGLNGKKDNDFGILAFGDGRKHLVEFLIEGAHNKVGYIIYNFKYTSPTDKIERLKRVFIMWAPPTSIIKDKIKITMYAQNAQKILSMGTNFHICLQANSTDDLSKTLILDKIKQKSTVF